MAVNFQQDFSESSLLFDFRKEFRGVLSLLAKFSKVNLKNGIIDTMAARKDKTADMKPRPNHDVYIKVLRRMTAEQHLLKAFELSALTRELFITGMRRRFPGLNAIELKKLIQERLERCHNQIY
jgi:hypothetical protein